MRIAFRWQLVSTGEILAADMWRLNARLGSARMARCLELLGQRMEQGGANPVILETALEELERLNADDDLRRNDARAGIAPTAVFH